MLILTQNIFFIVLMTYGNSRQKIKHHKNVKFYRHARIRRKKQTIFDRKNNT